MVFFFFLQAPFTGGEDGLQAVPRGSLLGFIDLRNDMNLYYAVVGIFLIGYFICWRVVNSPFGSVIKAIKENEPRCVSLGYDVDMYKLIVFIISAAIAGLAGATKTIVFVSATLSDAMWQTSGLVVLMTLIGGVGTFIGPVLGALIVVSLESKIGDIGRFLAEVTGVNWFNTLGESVSLIMGLIFIICVMAFRKGIVGELKAKLTRSGTNLKGGSGLLEKS